MILRLNKAKASCVINQVHMKLNSEEPQNICTLSVQKEKCTFRKCLTFSIIKSIMDTSNNTKYLIIYGFGIQRIRRLCVVTKMYELHQDLSMRNMDNTVIFVDNNGSFDSLFISYSDYSSTLM